MSDPLSKSLEDVIKENKKTGKGKPKGTELKKRIQKTPRQGGKSTVSLAHFKIPLIFFLVLKGRKFLKRGEETNPHIFPPSTPFVY